MLKRFIATAIAALASSAAMATVVTQVDLLDPSDGGTQPPDGVLVVDVFANVATPGGAWTAGGVRATTANGATLRYATDPNTGGTLLTNPGAANRFSTFFSIPRGRDVNGRFNNGAAAAAGRYSPTGPTATATASEINVAYFASPPPSAQTPPAAGYVFRVAINVPAGLPAGGVPVLTTGSGQAPAGNILLLSSTGDSGNDLGSVNATFDAPAVTGLNWNVSWTPEPSSLALLALGALAAFRRR